MKQYDLVGLFSPNTLMQNIDESRKIYILRKGKIKPLTITGVAIDGNTIRYDEMNKTIYAGNQFIVYGLKVQEYGLKWFTDKELALQVQALGSFK